MALTTILQLADGDAAPPPAATPNRAAEEAAAKAAAEKAARDAAEREEAERRAEADQRAEAERERERAERERKKQEAEQRAKAAAAAADADKKRREREREKQKELERQAAEEDAERKKQKEQERPSSSRKKSSEQSRSSSDSRRGPPPEALREWRDRSGQFRVDAAFLGFANGKLRLHKVNGVVIEVPAEKMSEEDLRYVQKLTKPKHRRSDDDDVPLEIRRRSLVPEPAKPPPKASPPKKGPTVDWFEFFLNAGCDVDDCTRYASAFERDKIDEAVLPDITEATMRLLGLREGDIIRVKKAIEQRKPKTSDPREEQMRKDEELARQLQAEENGSSLKTRSPAPNLFAGPNGEIKNMRRGRPQPSKSLPPSSVDIQSISTASDQIQRTGSPIVSSPEGIQQSNSSPAQLPPKETAPAHKFDDDAWTNRPSSTKPVAPTPPALVPRAMSTPPVAPPAPPPPPTSPPTAPTAPVVAVSPPPARAASAAPAAPAQASPPNPANATENDIFDQLSRIAAIRVNTPTAPQPIQAVAPPRAPSVNFTPVTSLSPPVGFQSGMGMGSSPVPMGQALQAQQTGMLPPANGPRGPFAPVPANQALLQPLVPTTGSFNGFVPTRQGVSPFQSPPPQQPLMQQQTGFPGLATPSMLPSQPTSMLQPQPTAMLQSQPTFQPQPIMSQPTGMPGGGYGGMSGGMNSFQPTPSFSSIQMSEYPARAKSTPFTLTDHLSRPDGLQSYTEQ